MPRGSLQAGGLDELGNAARSILSNREGEGKQTAELKEVSSVGGHLHLDASSGCLHRHQVLVGNGGCPSIRRGSMAKPGIHPHLAKLPQTPAV